MPKFLSKYGYSSRWVVLLFALAANISAPLHAQENKESLVKSAFMVNFLKFVEWPGEKAVSKQPKIDICVLGNSEISTASDIFKQASSENQAIALVGESSVKNAANHCHILFISESEEGRLGEITAALKGHPVLTVGDTQAMAEHGVMVTFVIADGKIKLVVNKRAVEEAGLRANAKLLQIAMKVVDR